MAAFHVAGPTVGYPQFFDRDFDTWTSWKPSDFEDYQTNWSSHALNIHVNHARLFGYPYVRHGGQFSTAVQAELFQQGLDQEVLPVPACPWTSELCYSRISSIQGLVQITKQLKVVSTRQKFAKHFRNGLYLPQAASPSSDEVIDITLFDAPEPLESLQMLTKYWYYLSYARRRGAKLIEKLHVNGYEYLPRTYPSQVEDAAYAASWYGTWRNIQLIPEGKRLDDSLHTTLPLSEYFKQEFQHVYDAFKRAKVTGSAIERSYRFMEPHPREVIPFTMSELAELQREVDEAMQFIQTHPRAPPLIGGGFALAISVEKPRQVSN